MPKPPETTAPEPPVDPHADNPRVPNTAKIVGAPEVDYAPES